MVYTKLLMFCFFFSLFFLSFSAAQNASCSNFQFHAKSFDSCSDLHTLSSFLHWSFDQSSRTIEMAFRKSEEAEQYGRWIAWAINPTSTGMVGSQAFVALQHSNGLLEAYTSPIDTYGTTLQKGNLSFRVYNVSAQNIDGELIIFAKFELPIAAINNNNVTIVNHVWQEGPLGDDDTPRMHALTGDNVKSFGTLDFHSGKFLATKPSSRSKLKIAHGIINGVSWGVLMPLGVVLARLRYLPLKVDPMWFYLHICCQSLGYLLGITGGTLGFVLGRQSSSGVKLVKHTSHRYIGGALLGLATLQVLALCLRPKKDHKYRLYWNMYHWCTGYATIILGIINCFKGFTMMDVGIWKNAYIGFLSSLGFVAAALEVLRWCLKARKSEPQQPIMDQQNA